LIKQIFFGFIKGIVKILKKILLGIWYFLYCILDFIIPKDHKIVIFSQQKERFFDNGRAFFEYISADDKWKSVWLAENNEVKNKIKTINQNYNVLLYYSLKGFWTALRAKFMIITYSLGDFGPYKYSSRNKIKIQLWHAITVKGYGLLDNKFTNKRMKKYINKETKNYNLVISSSPIDRYVTACCTGVNVRNVIVTGLPRNDLLLDSNNNNKDSIKGISISIKEKLNEFKIILYAPTFRDEGVTLFFPFSDYNETELIKYLRKKNAVILVRPHQNDFKNQKELKIKEDSSSGLILLAGNAEINDVSTLLPYVDVIVTDYSSIYIDLLLRDIPPVFIPYDLDMYESVRGLAYPYDLITPGPKVSNQDDFLSAIDDALERAPDYLERRYNVKNMFHYYNDGKACERILNIMEEKLKILDVKK